MMTISIYNLAGDFAENKDIARDVRIKQLMPPLKRKEGVILDFDRVDLSTQSFIHALISDPIRQYGTDVLDLIDFKNCNERVKTLISIVVDYMQEGLNPD